MRRSILVEVSEKHRGKLRAVGLGRARPAVRLPRLLDGQRHVVVAGELERVPRADEKPEPARVRRGSVLDGEREGREAGARLEKQPRLPGKPGQRAEVVGDLQKRLL